MSVVVRGFGVFPVCVFAVVCVVLVWGVSMVSLRLGMSCPGAVGCAGPGYDSVGVAVMVAAAWG